MKAQLLQAMKGFVLGSTLTTGITLLTFTGTENLESIKTLVQNHMTDTEQQVSLFMQKDYQVQVDNANAEIGEYKVALEKANGNIDKLITAYNNAETKHQEDLAQKETSHQQALEQALAQKETEHQAELTELQTELDNMKQNVDKQYKDTVDTLNGEIQKANEQVAETKRYIEEDVLPTSQIDEYIQQAKDYGKVNTGNDKSVHDISSIVPTEQPQK